MAEQQKGTPVPAPPAQVKRERKARTKRVLSSFEQSLRDEQRIANRIARTLASLSEEARSRVIQTLELHTQKA